MSAILDRIAARTRERLAAEPRVAAERAAEAAKGREPFAFSRAIGRDGVNVIAEIKAASPSAGPIEPDPDVEAIATAYAHGGAAAISIVTEPDFFSGSRAWIARARTAGLPVIMKDFVIDESQIIAGAAAGADAILLLASLLDVPHLREFISVAAAFGCDALVEVHDEAELERAVAANAKLIGVNNRDLRTFEVDLATSERLGPRIPPGVIRVAESGIRSHADVLRLKRAGFAAFLVGESLLRRDDRSAAVSALRGVALR